MAPIECANVFGGWHQLSGAVWWVAPFGAERVFGARAEQVGTRAVMMKRGGGGTDGGLGEQPVLESRETELSVTWLGR